MDGIRALAYASGTTRSASELPCSVRASRHWLHRGGSCVVLAGPVHTKQVCGAPRRGCWRARTPTSRRCASGRSASTGVRPARTVRSRALRARYVPVAPCSPPDRTERCQCRSLRPCGRRRPALLGGRRCRCPWPSLRSPWSRGPRDRWPQFVRSRVPESMPAGNRRPICRSRLPTASTVEQHRRHLVDLTKLRGIVVIPEREEAVACRAPVDYVPRRVDEGAVIGIVEQVGGVHFVPEGTGAAACRDLGRDVRPAQLRWTSA